MTTWEKPSGEVLICQHAPEGIKQKPNSAPYRIAAFDLDSTLIESKSGKLKTDDPEDWKWWHPSVPQRLRQAVDDGFHIVIITNQGRLTLRDGTISPVQELFKSKIESILEALDLPIMLYAACANDNWRKPRTRTWQHLLQRLSKEGNVDEGNSFLVGDAAGRVNDHSAADRHFCENVGIGFLTPEQWFLGAEKEEYIDGFDPKRYLELSHASKVEVPDLVPSASRAIYLLVGLPGAGKTTFFHAKMKPLGHETFDIRSANSEQVLVESITELFTSKQVVVLDDLNLDCESRKRWVSLARKKGVSIYAVHFTAPPELCIHNDAVRALSPLKSCRDNRKVYPRIAFWDVVDRFEEPTLEEGFDQVYKVDFEWAGIREARDIWGKFWI